MQEAAKIAVDDIQSNHYSVTKGRIRLRNALSSWFSGQFFDHGLGAGGKEGRKIDTDTEIVVTAGANEGASSSSLLTPRFLSPSLVDSDKCGIRMNK